MQDSQETTSSPSGIKEAGAKGPLRGGVGNLFLALLAIVVFRWAIAEPYVIPSGSMIPSLLVNDHIMVNKLAYGIRIPFTSKWLLRFAPPQRGDVVVFRSMEDDGFFMVKRVIGLPGDRISYSEDGTLMINDLIITRQEIPWESQGSEFYSLENSDISVPADQFQLFIESLSAQEKHRTLLKRQELRWSQEDIIVPEGHIFVMGDNRDNSRDSRAWGPLALDNLLGKASFVWLSCTKTLPNAPYLCDPSTIRWRRLFHFIE